MVNQKKKGEQGAAVNFVSRKKALKKLQLSLNDFRRLCILKGVYPHESNNRKKVQNGSSERKILYLIKEFLAQEPIINQFRNYKVFLRKLNHAKANREAEKYTKMIDNKPEYQLDRIVKEQRYPTFSSAIRELDDALCLCFVFSRFPRTKTLDTNLINECQRLTAEFMHYCIEARAVTNTFVSIKGIYYQAEILGEKVTWLVAHDRGLPVYNRRAIPFPSSDSGRCEHRARGEANKMREMMILKKQQRLYQKLKKGLKRTRTEARSKWTSMDRLEQGSAHFGRRPVSVATKKAPSVGEGPHRRRYRWVPSSTSNSTRISPSTVSRSLDHLPYPCHPSTVIPFGIDSRYPSFSHTCQVLQAHFSHFSESIASLVCSRIPSILLTVIR